MHWVLERNARRNIIADEKHERNKIRGKFIETVSVFLKRSARAYRIFKVQTKIIFSAAELCDYEDRGSVGKEKLKEMFPPRQIFSVVFDDDGTRTIYKVNRFVDFHPRRGQNPRQTSSRCNRANFRVLSPIVARKQNVFNRCTFYCTFCCLHIDTQWNVKFSLIAHYREMWVTARRMREESK